MSLEKQLSRRDQRKVSLPLSLDHQNMINNNNNSNNINDPSDDIIKSGTIFDRLDCDFARFKKIVFVFQPGGGNFFFFFPSIESNLARSWISGKLGSKTAKGKNSPDYQEF